MNGVGTAELTREMITKTFKNIKDLVGKSIYVSVNLLTESGKTRHILYVYVYDCV